MIFCFMFRNRQTTGTIKILVNLSKFVLPTSIFGGFNLSEHLTFRFQKYRVNMT